MTGSPTNEPDPAATTEHNGRLVARRPLRWATVLVGTYLGISVLTLVAIFMVCHNASAVTDAVWVRGSIVALTAALMFLFAIRATRGSRGAYLRLRIVSAIMLVAIMVIVALPGTLPLWMKIEQGLCGAVLLGVVAIVNGRAARSAFGGACARTAPHDEACS